MKNCNDWKFRTATNSFKNEISGFKLMGFEIMKMYFHILLNTKSLSDFEIVFRYQFKDCSIIQTLLNILKTGSEYKRFYDSYTDYFESLLSIQTMLFEWISEFIDFELIYKVYEDLLFIDFVDENLDFTKIKSFRLSVIHKWFLLVFSKGKEQVFKRVKNTFLIAVKLELYKGQDLLLDELRPLLARNF